MQKRGDQGYNLAIRYTTGSFNNRSGWKVIKYAQNITEEMRGWIEHSQKIEQGHIYTPLT